MERKTAVCVCEREIERGELQKRVASHVLFEKVVHVANDGKESFQGHEKNPPPCTKAGKRPCYKEEEQKPND
jgi:hypothetical protein